MEGCHRGVLVTFDSRRGRVPSTFAATPPLALVSRTDVSASLLGEEGEEAGAVGLRLDVDDGGILGEQGSDDVGPLDIAAST